MIWLLTRVMISSTVCPDGAGAAGAGAGAAAGAGAVVLVADGTGTSACPSTREGRQIKITRMRGRFFIGCVGPPRLLACGQRVGSDRRNILLLRRKPGGQPIGLTPGSPGKLAGKAVEYGRANLGRLVRADQGQSGAIVAHGHIAGEGSGGVQNGRAECLGTAGRGILKKLVDTSQAEFVFMVGLFVAALAADDSARNKQNSGTFFEADGGSVGGGVGEESQRQA